MSEKSEKIFLAGNRKDSGNANMLLMRVHQCEFQLQIENIIGLW